MDKQKNNVQNFFNEESESWKARYFKSDFESVSYQDRMNAAFSLLNKYAVEKNKILDAGCGAGIQSLALLKSRYNVVSCDIALDMVKQTNDIINEFQCKENHGAIVTDLEHSSFKSGTFDAVVILGVIGYSLNPDEILKTLQKILKPGGILIISTASQKLLLNRISRIISKIPNMIYKFLKNLITGNSRKSNKHDNGFYVKHYNYTDARDFDNYLEQNNYKKIDSIGVNFGRFTFMEKQIFPEKIEIKLSRLISKFARFKLLSWLERYSRIYVVCLRKS